MAKTTQTSLHQTEKCLKLSLGNPSLTRFLPEFFLINECFLKLRKLLFLWGKLKKYTLWYRAFSLQTSNYQGLRNHFLTSSVKSNRLVEAGYTPACHVGLLFVISHHVLKVIWCEHTILYDKESEACAVHGQPRVIRSHTVTNGGLCLVFVSTLS